MSDNLIDEMFRFQTEVSAYFSYKEDWKVIPWDDCRQYWWILDQKPDGRGRVIYSKEILTVESIRAGTAVYSSDIYTQRFLPKWVYRSDAHVMIATDPHTDGNKFLSIFANEREQHEPELISAWNESWGNI